MCEGPNRPPKWSLAHRPTLSWPEGTWETTHLGGHRFAATLLALPSLVTLGRLLPHEAVAVCSDLAEGRVPPSHVRGRAGWPAAAQVADQLVRRELGLEPLAATGLVGVVDDDITLSVAGETWRVRVATTPGEPRRQSCADDRVKPTTVHRVEALVRLEHPCGGVPPSEPGLGSGVAAPADIHPTKETRMTTTPDEPLNDDDMTTGSAPQASSTPSDADATDADADGTDGDASDGDSSDATDGDGSDADGTDADATDGDSTDSTDGDAS